MEQTDIDSKILNTFYVNQHPAPLCLLAASADHLS